MTNQNKAFFIVGCPRSGTTLLQSMLSSHPELYSTPETSFFNRIIPLLGIEYTNPEKIVTSDDLEKIKNDFFYMTGKTIDIDVESLQGNNIKVIFEQILNSFNYENKKYWIEKTTNHARSLMLIHKFYPDAKIIHIIRDPVDAIASMNSIRPTSITDFRLRYISSLTGFVNIWKKCVAGALQYPYQSNVHHFYYEDLVRNPEEELINICRFLSVEYNEDMNREYCKNSGHLFSVERCPWQESNKQNTIATNTIGKGRRSLSAGDIWFIQRLARFQMNYFGYLDNTQSANCFSCIKTLLVESLCLITSVSSIEIIIRRILEKFNDKTI